MTLWHFSQKTGNGFRRIIFKCYVDKVFVTVLFLFSEAAIIMLKVMKVTVTHSFHLVFCR